jgi:hypothetical protein
MAPRTRKTAPVTAPADETPDETPDDPIVAEEETVDEEALFVAPAPEAGVDYFADVAFTAQLDAQLVSFGAGEKLDPIAGAYLAAAGAPVSTQAHPD